MFPFRQKFDGRINIYSNKEDGAYDTLNCHWLILGLLVTKFKLLELVLLTVKANSLVYAFNVVGMSIEKMWRNDEMTKFWNIM